MPFKDPEKRRAYHRGWEAKHSEKCREYRRKKYKKHREKLLARGRKWRQEHKEWERARWYRRTPELEAKRKLRALWKVSPRSRRRFERHSSYLAYEIYERILPQLEGMGPCDCCQRRDMKMHIDHDHKEMKFRGVLCHQCNKGLGHFGDSIERLRQAAAYLERSRKGI